MKVACVLVPHFRVQVETEARPELRGRPVILLGPRRRSVLEVSPQVVGVTPGMPLSEALARCPAAVLLEPDWPRYAAAYARMLDGLGQHSPLMEEAEMGVAYVGLDGLELLYGGEARLLRALLESVPLPAQLGVAQVKFPAYLAARSAAPGAVVKVGEDAPAFLSRFLVEVLPLPWEVIARLRGFGLHTLGQLAEMPVGPLQAQFGPWGRLAWELARGLDPRPLVPRRQEERVTERLEFASPVVATEALLLAVEMLLGRAFARPALRGRAVQVATIEASAFRAAPFVSRMVFKPAAASQERAYSVLKGKLGEARLPGPLEALRLTLGGLTGEVAQQESFWLEVRRREPASGGREAVRQLKVHLGGKAALYRIRMVEPWSRIPERRMVLVEYAP